MIRSIEVLGDMRAVSTKDAITKFTDEAMRHLQGAVVDFTLDEVEAEDAPKRGVYPMRAVFIYR